MPQPEQSDDLVMGLLLSALSHTPEEREHYLRNACSGNTVLFDEVWSRVEWESRMKGFMLEPVLPAMDPETDAPFKPGDFLDGRFRSCAK